MPLSLVHAQIIEELLTNTGYGDDADELLADRMEETGREPTMKFAQDLDSLIVLINEVLPTDNKFSTIRSMVDEVNLI